MIMVHCFIDSLKCFYFGSILLSIVHNDTMESWNVLSCSVIAYYQIIISNNTKTRLSVVEILYENIPLTEMLSRLKVAANPQGSQNAGNCFK